MLKKGRRISIYVQAAMAVMFIQLVHKIVREIPHALNMEGPGGVFTIVLACLLAVGILLLFVGIRWGLLLGIVDAVWMLFQPILVHVILARPAVDGIWWYPVFPWTQAILILYFCILAWKELGQPGGEPESHEDTVVRVGGA
jgi:hypothetical protein